MTIGDRTAFLPDSIESDRPRGLRQAAEAFEALLLSQLLRSVRESGADGEPDRQMGGSILEMAEEQLAQAVAKSGGVGLAAIITRQLEPSRNTVQTNSDLSMDR